MDCELCVTEMFVWTWLCLVRDVVEMAEQVEGLGAHCSPISTSFFLPIPSSWRRGSAASYVGCILIASQVAIGWKHAALRAVASVQAFAWFLRGHSPGSTTMIGWGRNDLHHRDVSARPAALVASLYRGGHGHGLTGLIHAQSIMPRAVPYERPPFVRLSADPGLAARHSAAFPCQAPWRRSDAG